MRNSRVNTDRPCIGLLGGTFNPVHIGHVNLVQQVCKKLPQMTVHLLPNHTPPHKSTLGVDHRVSMLKYIVDGDKVLLNLAEVERGEISFTTTTLKQLRLKYPQHSLVWIAGDDFLQNLDNWHDWYQILDYCHLWIYPRLRMELSDEIALKLESRQVMQAHRLVMAPAGFVFYDELMPHEAVSSTQIREIISKGGSISNLVPKKVEAYIMRHKLYAG